MAKERLETRARLSYTEILGQGSNNQSARCIAAIPKLLSVHYSLHGLSVFKKLVQLDE